MNVAGHIVKCRPPYRPHEAPIEWAFNRMGCEICNRWEFIRNDIQLIENVHDIIDNRKYVDGFAAIFSDCGYINK